MIQGKSLKMLQKAALVIGVLMIPLMYSYFYLNAFWDPYQRLDKVPVAVVNLDEGAVINDEERNLGDEITDKLKEEKELGFDFTTAEKAKEGVLKDQYYASITIPKDFSADAATVGEDTKKLHGKIIYSANQKKNYLAAQILENAMPKIKEEVNSKIDKQIVGTISAKVKDVPKQLGKLDEGLLKLDTGAMQLSDGTAKLAGGAGELSDGVSTLNGKVPTLKKGVSKLDKGAAELASGMKKLTGKSKDLKDGASQLADGASDLVKGLMEYTAGVSKANGGASELKKGGKSYTDGVSQAGSGAGELENGLKTYTDGVSQAGQGASALGSGLKEYTKGVDDAASGASQIKDGMSKVSSGLDDMESKVSSASSSLGDLKTGASDLSSGISNFKEGYDQAYQLLAAGQTEQAQQVFGQLKQNLPSLKSGAASLSGGIEQFAGGMQELSGGITQLQGAVGSNGTITNGVSKLNAGLSVLQSKNDTLNQSASQLSAGLGKLDSNSAALNQGASQLKGGLSQLQSNNEALNNGASALSSGLDTLSNNNDKLNSGASQLSSGSSQLSSGVKAYTKGVGTAGSGASQLSSGTGKLTGSIPTLASGVNKLDNGAAELAKGAGALDNGVGKLSSGIHTASDEVSSSVAKANSQVGVLDGLPEYAAKPVDTETQYVQGVKNYGSAFAPYFMGLSLWVGGLLIFFGLYFDYNRRIKLLTRDSRRFILRSFAFALVSIGQGILLAFIIKYALHIAVNHTAMFYFGCILTALSFTAVIQFCIINLGDIGKFLVMLLLILQLTSCAGTFPIETQNAFFRAINPFLPMTYSTQLFKEAISGTIGSNFWNSALILAAFAVGFLILTNIFSYKAIKNDIMEMARRGADESHAKA